MKAEQNFRWMHKMWSEFNRSRMLFWAMEKQTMYPIKIVKILDKSWQFQWKLRVAYFDVGDYFFLSRKTNETVTQLNRILS